MIRLILLFVLCFPLYTIAQTSFQLDDGRGYEECYKCEEVLRAAPHEVRYSVHISGDGSLTFSTNSILWFHKLFADPKMGIAVELVSRKLYSCGSTLPDFDLTRGYVTKPVYRAEMLKRADTIGGHIRLKAGTVPAHLRNEVLEANLLFINDGYMCNRRQVVNIEQDILDLLPMGLYTDTLIQKDIEAGAKRDKVIMFTTRKSITIPFRKGTAALSAADLQVISDSLKGYSIRHEEMRAYSSVEGPEAVNVQLMKQRGAAVQQAIASLGFRVSSYKLLPVENWIEFYHDVPALANKSKKEVKNLLQDKAELSQLEPILAGHRKVVVNVWLDKPTRLDTMDNAALLPTFDRLVAAKDIPGSRQVIKEIAIRIAENRLPENYISQLDVPFSIEYQTLIADQAIYRNYLKDYVDNVALSLLYELRKTFGSNSFLNYNICVLELINCHGSLDSTINLDSLEVQIRHLEKEGIHPSLVARMLVNLNIIQCERYMRESKYDKKDKALEYIYKAFQSFALDDRARYSLAQFFTAYSRLDLALNVVRPRVNQLDADENIIFYFINLGFFGYVRYDEADFKNAVLNAVNLNRARFCKFFQSADRGGASFQLLENTTLRKLNCDNCPN